MASPEPLSEGLLLFDRYQLEAPLGARAPGKRGARAICGWT